MSVQSVADRFVELCRQGKNFDVMRTMYAPNIVSVEGDGKERKGLAGLREYLRDRRQEDFVNNLCRKLLSYALGRSLQPSDRATLDAMRARLAAENYAFGSLVDVIVNSPQFRNVK